MPLLQLVDHLDQQYEFEVSDDDFNKVLNGDLILANELLDKHREKENFIAARILQDGEETFSKGLVSSKERQLSDFPNTSSNSLENVFPLDSNLQNKNYAEDKEHMDNKIWNINSTKMLISLYKKYDREFETGVKKYVWVKIAARLSEAFKIVYTYQQCDTKFKVLKNLYKTVKKHNEQSGNNKKIWQYYDLMHEIMFKKPEITAVATCSSAKGLTVGGTTVISNDATAQMSTPEQVDNISFSSQSEVDDPQSGEEFQSTLMRKRKHYENATERRHREKMSRQDKYLSLLERLTLAVEKTTQTNV